MPIARNAHLRHRKDLLMDLLEGINALLEIDVIRGQLGLWFGYQ